jgi:hypothetical protein
MPKVLCIAGAVVAVLIVLVFGVDMAVRFPFGRENWIMDIGMTLGSVALGYLSWSTFRQLA